MKFTAAAGNFDLPPVIRNYRDYRDLIYINIRRKMKFTAAAAGIFDLPPVIQNYRDYRDLIYNNIRRKITFPPPPAVVMIYRR